MQSFETYRGDDFVINLTFKTSAGAVQVITGWTIFFTAKKNKGLGDTDDGVVRVAGVITGDGSTGIATVTLGSGTTGGMLGSYYYDIQYKDLSGTIKTVMEGVLTFKEDVTRRTT